MTIRDMSTWLAQKVDEEMVDRYYSAIFPHEFKAEEKRKEANTVATKMSQAGESDVAALAERHATEANLLHAAVMEVVADDIAETDTRERNDGRLTVPNLREEEDTTMPPVMQPWDDSKVAVLSAETSEVKATRAKEADTGPNIALQTDRLHRLTPQERAVALVEMSPRERSIVLGAMSDTDREEAMTARKEMGLKTKNKGGKDEGKDGPVDALKPAEPRSDTPFPDTLTTNAVAVVEEVSSGCPEAPSSPEKWLARKKALDLRRGTSEGGGTVQEQRIEDRSVPQSEELPEERKSSTIGLHLSPDDVVLASALSHARSAALETENAATEAMPPLSQEKEDRRLALTQDDDTDHGVRFESKSGEMAREEEGAAADAALGGADEREPGSPLPRAASYVEVLEAHHR